MENHRSAWPTGIVLLGSTEYHLSDPLDVDYLIGILRTPDRGDAWINLAQKVIAGELSMLRDPGVHWAWTDWFGGTYSFVELMDMANDWLATHTSPCGPRSAGRDTALSLAAIIDHCLNYFDIG